VGLLIEEAHKEWGEYKKTMTNNKQQTAVDWLGLYIKGITTLNCDDIIEQAKEMEKEQIIDFAYVIADDLACGVYREKKAMEKRYNEFLTYREEDDDI